MPTARRMLARIWHRRPRQLDVQEGYRQWAPVYPARAHNKVMQVESEAVAAIVRTLGSRRALDVGTGTGRNLGMLKDAGVAVACGVDLSMAMLRAADHDRRRAQGTAYALPFLDGVFDLITSSLMCGDVEDLDTWLAEASRTLAPGGNLVYSDFHPAWSQEGWRRTFTGADGRFYELPLHPHAIAEHLGALHRHGLVLCQRRELRLPERPFPVVLVVHARRATLDAG